jgi:Sulfotransferase domain
MTRSIVWLASYPKSGNTWVRVLLANYLADKPRPVPINEVPRIAFGDANIELYRKVAGPFVDFSNDRAFLDARQKLLGAISGNGADVNFLKTHATRAGRMGRALIPPAMTRAAVYILRNPLDVALSYARHYGLEIDRAVETMGNPLNRTRASAKSVPQVLGSWSEHVRSWTRGREFPVHVVRYEDLHAEPEARFGAILGTLGVTPDAERLARAVRFSSFDELSRQEAESGFIEKPDAAERFFARGRSGQWETDLPPDLAARIRRDHGAVMERHGYL